MFFFVFFTTRKKKKDDRLKSRNKFSKAVYANDRKQPFTVAIKSTGSVYLRECFPRSRVKMNQLAPRFHTIRAKKTYPAIKVSSLIFL